MMMPSQISVAAPVMRKPRPYPRLWRLVFELAKEEGMSRLSLKNWRQRGLPRSWHSRLLLRARDKGIRLSIDELELLSNFKMRRKASRHRADTLKV